MKEVADLKVGCFTLLLPIPVQLQRRMNNQGFSVTSRLICPAMLLGHISLPHIYYMEMPAQHLCGSLCVRATALCIHCRLAMTAAVKQLLRQGMDDGVEKSILPAAQWVRAAHLLKAAVDSVDDEQPTGYTCKESKVTTFCPFLAGDLPVLYRAACVKGGA